MKKIIVLYLLFFHGSLFASDSFYGHDVNVDFVEKLSDFAARKHSRKVERSMIEVMGTEVQTSFVDYKDQQIGYNYQMWKIKHDTVCSNVFGDIAKLSACTVKAKSLFGYLCTQFTEKDNGFNWKVGKFRMMYCAAATNYEPVIALITKPSVKLKEKTSLLKSKCDSLIFEAMSINADESLEKERDIVCSKYEKEKADN